MLPIIFKKSEVFSYLVRKACFQGKKASSTEPFGGASLHPTYLDVLTPYAIRNTHKGRRLTEIYLEYARHFA